MKWRSFYKKHPKLIAAACGLLLGAAGAILVPRTPQVQVVEKIVERETKVRGEDVVKVVYRTRIVRPDGTQEERTEERTDSKTRETSARDATKSTVSTPVAKQYRVTALVGAPIQLAAPTLTVGALVERRLAGPLSAGVWAIGTPATGSVSAGLALSLEF